MAMTERQPPINGRLTEYLAQADKVILPRSLGTAQPLAIAPHRKLRVGVDLGTAYLVLVVLDEDGTPLAGEWQFAEVVRDGLVVDFVGAADLLRGMKAARRAAHRPRADPRRQRLPARRAAQSRCAPQPT